MIPLLVIILLYYIPSIIFGFHIKLIIFIPSLILSYFIFSNILKKYFDIEFASVNDIVQKYCETPESKSRITVGIIFEDKIDPLLFIEKMKSRALMHFYYKKLMKILHVNTNFFALFGYWKKSNNFDINQHIEICNEQISSEERFYEYLATHLSITDFEKNKPEWNFYIFPNFLENKSAMIMNIHHCYIDGISGFTYFLNLTDCKDYKFINLPKFSKFQWIFVCFFGCLTFVYSYLRYMIRKYDYQPFHTGKITGKKRIFSTEACTIESIKKFTKENKVTINDTLTAVLCESLHKYCKEHYNKEIDNMLAMIPASLRPMPKPEKHYPLENHSVVFLIKLPLTEESNTIQRIKLYSSIYKKLKTSYDTYVTRFALELMPFLFPPKLLRFFIRFVSNKVSFLFTNVPGPVNQLVCYGKYRVERIITTVNLFSDLALAFSIVSYHGKIAFTCIADESINFDPKIFIQMFKGILEKEICNS